MRRIVSFEEQPARAALRGRRGRGRRRAVAAGAFSRALKSRGDVIVDLAELSFADASLMFDLAMLAKRLRDARPPSPARDAQPQIARLIELVGLHRFPGVLVGSRRHPRSPSL